MRIWFKLPNGHGADICFKDLSRPKRDFVSEITYWKTWARKALGKDVLVAGTNDGERCP